MPKDDGIKRTIKKELGKLRSDLRSDPTVTGAVVSKAVGEAAARKTRTGFADRQEERDFMGEVRSRARKEK